MAAGHNGVVTGGRLLARAALVGALVLGVVGMHHLVIAACHHLGVSSTSSAMVMDHHAGHSVPTEVPAAPAPAISASAAPVDDREPAYLDEVEQQPRRAAGR